MTPPPDHLDLASEAASPASPPTDLIDIRQWLGDAVWPDRWRILSVTAATAVVALVVALLLPKSYEARASLTITATPAEMEVNGRIAMSADLLNVVLDQAGKQGLIAAGDSPVFRADPDTTHPSNPTPLLTLLVRTGRPETSEAIARIWAQAFIDVASESMRRDREASLEAMRENLIPAKALVDKAQADNERTVVQTDREQAALIRTLDIEPRRQQATLLTAAISDLARRIDAQRLAREQSSFEVSVLARDLGVASGADEEAAGLPPSSRTPGVLAALLTTERDSLANTQKLLLDVSVDVAKLTADVQTITKELEGMPATTVGGEPNRLYGELTRRLSRSRIDLQSATAQVGRLESEIQDRQSRIDALSAEMQAREIWDKLRLAQALQRKQDADIKASEAQMRDAGRRLDNINAEIADRNIQLTATQRDVSRRRERSIGDLNRAIDAVSKLNQDIAATEKLLSARATTRLVAIEAGALVSSLRYLMAMLLVASAFAVMVLVASVRHRVPAA